MPVRRRTQGRDKLNQKLMKLPEEVRAALALQLLREGEDLADVQRRLAPVRTGALRRSIRVQSGEGGVAYGAFGSGAGRSGRSRKPSRPSNPDRVVVRVTAGDAQARHAALIEFGTAPHITGGRTEGAQHPGSQAIPFFFPPYRARKKSIKSKATNA